MYRNICNSVELKWCRYFPLTFSQLRPYFVIIINVCVAAAVAAATTRYTLCHCATMRSNIIVNWMNASGNYSANVQRNTMSLVPQSIHYAHWMDSCWCVCVYVYSSLHIRMGWLFVLTSHRFEFASFWTLIKLYKCFCLCVCALVFVYIWLWNVLRVVAVFGCFVSFRFGLQLFDISTALPRSNVNSLIFKLIKTKYAYP